MMLRHGSYATLLSGVYAGVFLKQPWCPENSSEAPSRGAAAGADGPQGAVRMAGLPGASVKPAVENFALGTS